MTEDLLPNHRLSIRYGLAGRRAGRIPLSTTIALVVVAALAVIAVSIGIAQAETLGVMVDDETGRLALFGLIFIVIVMGAITALMMWATAPAAPRTKVACSARPQVSDIVRRNGGSGRLLPLAPINSP